MGAKDAKETAGNIKSFSLEGSSGDSYFDKRWVEGLPQSNTIDVLCLLVFGNPLGVTLTLISNRSIGLDGTNGVQTCPPVKWFHFVSQRLTAAMYNRGNASAPTQA